MTNNTITHLQRRRELTEQLVLEYAGAVPPGQVMSAVVRADHLLSADHIDLERRLAVCEVLVRRTLAESAARGGPVGSPASSSPMPQSRRSGRRPACLRAVALGTLEPQSS